MKTNSHIKSQSEAQSLRFNQIKRVAKVAAIIIGAIIGTLVWAMVRPCNPRCGLGYIPHNRNTDNLLDIHTLIQY